MKPYFAVIFTSKQTENVKGYAEMATLMEKIAKKQPGYLGIKSARNEIGITVSYWETEADIVAWKEQIDHQAAQKMGKSTWYEWYKIEIAEVKRAYHS